MNCIQSECMNRTTGCARYGECQAERMKREARNTISLTLGGMSVSPCLCVGPQNGQPLCPCQMKAQAGLNLDKGNRVGVSAQVTHPFGFTPMAQQGWECPRCKTIHAPFMPTCMNCKPPKVDYTQGAGDPVKTGGAP